MKPATWRGASLSLVVVLIGACAGGPQPNGGGLTPSAQPQHFEAWQVTDPLASDVVALRFLVPSGWQGEGQVEWLPQWERLVDLQTRVIDPTSGLTIAWLPIQDFIFFQPPQGFDVPIGGNYQGKAYVPPVTDPVEFVNNFWVPSTLAHLANSTLINVDQVPAVAAEFKRGFGGPGDAFAYRLRYEFNSNGQTWEEDVSFALLYSSGPEVTSWYVNFAYTVRAPKGELDRQAGTISTIVASRATTPQWEAVFRLTQQLFIQGLQQQMADTVAFGQLLAQHRAETEALQQQITQERQASQDRIAQLRGETLEGIQNFVNPFDQSIVQMPSNWNDYWVNPQGDYLISDQANFDPNQVANLGTWQRLQPSQR